MLLDLFNPHYPLIHIRMEGAIVRSIQNALLVLGWSITPDGYYGPQTVEVVKAFQLQNRLLDDGVIGSITLQAIRKPFAIKPSLQSSDIEQAANQLNVNVATIKAVSSVESKGCGFHDDGRCIILYERHVMRRSLLLKGFTVEPFCVAKPNLVNVKTGGYSGGLAEYNRLYDAMEINREAALNSVSWGAFQIMGFHWQHLGYPDVVSFVTAMETSEAEQLNAFVRFIKADNRLHTALQEHHWKQFSKLYNGPAYASHKVPYDVRLAEAYKKFDS